MTRRHRRRDPELARLRRAALDAAAAGLHVFPVRAGSKIPALHGEAGCRCGGVCADGHQGWEQRATTNPDQIRRWWSGPSRWNLGIATGPSGLLVVDLDTRGGDPPPEWTGATDGHEVLVRLAAAAGETIPDTYTVTTPTAGGRHLYFHAPTGLGLRNTAGHIGPWVDSRGGGGFVVGAGSIRPDGAYTVAHHGPVATLPDWLGQLLTPPPPPEPRSAPLTLPTDRANAYVAAILTGETDTIRDAPNGQRQATLLAAARTLGRLVGGGELDADNARAVLLDAAATHIGVDGFTRREAERTVDRALAYGARAPRRIDRRHTSARTGEGGGAEGGQKP